MVHEHSAPGNAHSAHRGGFPWQYTIGFILSVVLTLGALWLVLAHALPLGWLLLAILALASTQIFVQLFFFMHVLEGEGPPYHAIALAVGLVFTIAIVGGSIWIMSFSAQVS